MLPRSSMDLDCLQLSLQSMVQRAAVPQGALYYFSTNPPDFRFHPPVLDHLRQMLTEELEGHEHNGSVRDHPQQVWTQTRIKPPAALLSGDEGEGLEHALIPGAGGLAHARAHDFVRVGCHGCETLCGP